MNISPTGTKSDNRYPDRAIVEQLGKYFVTVVGAGSKAEPRPVQLGPRSAGLVVIEAGLKPGEQVVVEGALKARPGATLKPVAISEADLLKGSQVLLNDPYPWKHPDGEFGDGDFDDDLEKG